MPSSPTSQVVVVDSESPQSLVISAWPLRDEPRAAVIVLSLAAGLSVGAGLVAASWMVGFLAALALLVALRDWILPCDFQIDELGVKRLILGRSRRVPWRELTACRIYERGVLLLPDADAAPLDLLRGLYVPFGQQREGVLAIVTHHQPQATDSTDEHMVRQQEG